MLINSTLQPDLPIQRFKPNWLAGYVSIKGQNPETGEEKLLLDKQNSIMYQGADLIASGLIGRSISKITHLYVGYSNSLSLPANGYEIEKDVTAFSVGANLGWVKVPLTYPAVATTSDDALYVGNIVNFSVLLSNPASFVQAGSAALTNNTSRFFEAALVSETIPGSNAGDKMLARIAFSSITYQQNYNLTVNWGIQITSA